MRADNLAWRLRTGLKHCLPGPALPGDRGTVVVLAVLVLTGLGCLGHWRLASPRPAEAPEYGPFWMELIGPDQKGRLVAFPAAPARNQILAAAGLTVRDNKQILVPAFSRVVISRHGKMTVKPMTGAARWALARKMDLNTATYKDLVLLPGLGPKTAGRILAARQVRLFSRLHDLEAIDGLGQKTLAGLKPYAAVSPNPNIR